MPKFKLFPRYRRPSLGTALGITQVKRQVSRKLGLAVLRDPTTPVKNLERRALRKAGYYSEPMKAARAFGLLPRLSTGCLLPLLIVLLSVVFLVCLY